MFIRYQPSGYSPELGDRDECAEILFHTRKILCTNMARRITNLNYEYMNK